MFRKQAKQWLAAELGDWTKLLAKANAQERSDIARTLRHWQQDPDLAGLRDEKELAKLSEDVRKEWQSLWAEVAVLLRMVVVPASTDGKP
jgi:hypothetical protein